MTESKATRTFKDYEDDGATHPLNEKEKRQFINNLPKLYSAQKFISDNLIGKARYYFYKDDRKMKWIEVRFGKKNFMHLCGVKYVGGPRRFWDKACQNRLSLKQLEVKNDGSTFQKLQVINAIKDLGSLKLVITSQGVLLRLHYDHLLRTKREIMGIGLGETDYHYVPLSLLNLQDQQDKFKTRRTQSFSVAAIVDKDIVTGEFVQVLPNQSDEDYIHFINKN